MEVDFLKYNLNFKKPGGTSRGVLKVKETYILRVKDGKRTAYGECNFFRGLSYDDRPGYKDKLADVCNQLRKGDENVLDNLEEWPSIKFGVETVLKDIHNGFQHIIFPDAFGPSGFNVPINGLIWMGEKEDMLLQIRSKLKEGYASIKLKIGAVDFETEMELLKFIRSQVSSDEVEVRVDANGAFSFQEAKEKIKRLSDFQVSYIEQPIKAGQWQEMAALTEDTPVKIALDEELIGITNSDQKENLIKTIKPQLLILKPALCGGFEEADEWKNLVETSGGSWVVTSALESNIGLNAIAQYTAVNRSEYAQGLGTGQLYTNNFPSPYSVNAYGLQYHPFQSWDFNQLP